MSKEKKYKSFLDVDAEIIDNITQLIQSRADGMLKVILADLYDYDIAVVIDNLEDEDSFYLFSLLNDETASEVILEISDEKRDAIIEHVGEEKIANVVSEMHSDDATDFISELDEEVKEEVLEKLDDIDAEDYREVKELLQYDENTAGGLMGKEFIAINEDYTVDEAIKEIQVKADDVDQFYNVWVVDNQNILKGIVSLKRLIIALKEPQQKLKSFMNPDVISVEANVDQEEVAKLFSSYDLVSLPVVDAGNRVIGKISIDDVVDVLEEEYSEDVAKMVGSDAEELEKKSPFAIAQLRLPWLIITLLMELVAGFIISFYDTTLQKVILLVSFQPLISAIAGSTGLQSSAIIVRALDTGYITITNWFTTLKRQMLTTLIIGLVIGIIVGAIGYLWSDTDKVSFGLSVGISMFISINLSGIVGTLFPLFSKRLGFDPAISSGPFGTAFQDVVGIAIYLSIATYLLSRF